MMQMGTARSIGTFRKAGEAARSPPLSSRIGIIEIIKTIASPESFPARFAVNHVTSDCIDN